MIHDHIYHSSATVNLTSVHGVHIGLFQFFDLQYCGHTALTFACLREDMTSTSALLKLGANPNVCTEVCSTSKTCLENSSFCGL